MRSETEIIQTLFNIHKEDIPRIYHNDFENLEDLDPGMNGVAVKMVLDNLDVINEGRILVVSGPIGCGKTFAAFTLTLYRDWLNIIEPDYQKVIQDINDEHWHKFEGEDLETVVNEPENTAFKYAIRDYAKWVKSRQRLKFARAIEVIELGFDIKSLRNFSGLVVIDDLGRDHFTDKGFGISRWDGFFDVRYSELLPTLITTNMTPEEFIEKYNTRIYDRLKQIAEWITINEQSLRGKGE